MAPLNLYDVTIPGIIATLEAFSRFLEKGSSTASEKGVSVDDLATGKLIDDMRPLGFQVSIACNTAKFIAIRLGGVTNIEWDDNISTFDQYQARLKETIAFLKTAKREDFEGKETAEVEFRDLKFSGLGYVIYYAIPNFYFHVTAAYTILRSKGIDVGKMDFLAQIRDNEALRMAHN